jgi:hypothetical protein
VSRASVASGDNGAPVFPTNLDELMVTGDAPEHGRKNRTREREPEDTLVRRNRRFTAAALGFSGERF